MSEIETFKKIITSTDVKEIFELALQDKPQIVLAKANLAHVLTNTKYLDQIEPVSIANAVVQMTNLGFSAQTGESYIIKYGERATFQIGYRGWVQLAQRSGKVKKINAIRVFEGQYKGSNPLEETFEFDWTNKKSDSVIGYAARLETVDGFIKTLYWTKEQMHQHFTIHSKNNYDEKKQLWMANKKEGIVSKILTVERKGEITMLKQLISQWAPKNASINLALTNDGRSYNDSGVGVFENTQLIENKHEEEIAARIPARRTLIFATLQQFVDDGKKIGTIAHHFTDKKVSNKYMNSLAKQSGIDFNVSNGWAGVTEDELKLFAGIVEQIIGKDFIVNGRRLAIEKAQNEQETEISFVK